MSNGDTGSSSSAMGSGDHMSNGAMSSADHMAASDKKRKKKVAANGAMNSGDHMPSGSMSSDSMSNSSAPTPH